MIESLNTINKSIVPSKNNLVSSTQSNQNKESNPQIGNFQESFFIAFSDDANNILNSEKIESEINVIFGTGKPLSTAQKEEIASIEKQIDDLLGIKPITKEEEAAVNKMIQSIDDIFKDGKVTDEEEKQLKDLDNKISKIYGDNKEIVLSPSDEKKLDDLYAKLDNIFGLPTLSKEDLLAIDVNGEDIMTNFPPFKKLTDSEQKQADQINKQIDDLYGIKTLSTKDMALADKIHKQIDDLFADGKITNEEEKQLQSLDKRLVALYGEPKILSEAENKKVDELFQSLDKLYGFNELDKDGLIKAEKLYSTLDAIQA